MKYSKKIQLIFSFWLLFLFGFIAIHPLKAQAQPNDDTKPVPTLGLEQGYSGYITDIFTLELINASQTVFALKNNADAFDYSPNEWIKYRNGDNFYHLGDINLRLKTDKETNWREYSTAKERHAVDKIIKNETTCLSAANLKNTLPDDFPLQIERIWEKKNENIVLKFSIKNPTNQTIEIGALGIPVVFNNNISEKSLDEAHAENVFFDPYIGADAGYLQVIRLHGHGNPLLVLPYGESAFEAYRPLLDDPTPRGITFEGFHEWMIHSKAYALNEWKNSQPWNVPSSKILKPNETYSVGLEFVLAPSIKEIEQTLIKNNCPVAMGIPGYVLPMDVNGKLFLNYSKDVKEIKCSPENALTVEFSKITKNGWKEYRVNGKKWGRALLTITYADGKKQTINYKLIKPEAEVVADNGRFVTNEQWYENKDDLFNRSPSPITYDYETKQKVTQDPRVWIAGLSDEGGAGAWLNAMMKQLVSPNAEEIKKLERFMNETLWGGIQYSDGKEKYGVRKSMFYYEPDSMPKGTYSDTINYKTWAGWSKKASESVGRSYNYPHVAAAHWVMYRLARYYSGLVTKNDWKWYLTNAYQTTMAMINLAPHYAQFGQMEGSVFVLILDDLKKEGFNTLAIELEAAMKKRTEHWATLNYPFGSEMPWDSTGQEEIYMWSRYFGFSDKALVTLNAILAYMPTIPHWAYNGNARRYWDFLFGGKHSQIERMIHHYGSAINAIPVLNEYRFNSDDLYLLRVGYGGVLGALSNITKEGFAPCASHSFPDILKNDGISGDYGSGYYGYAVNTATYIINDNEFGWMAFGGNITTDKDWVKTKITTASKSKVFIAEADAWINLNAGNITSVDYNTATKEIKITLSAKNKFTNKAFVNISTGKGISNSGVYNVKGFTKNERGDYEIALNNKPSEIILTK